MIFRCKNYDATEFTKEKACQQGKRPEATLQTTEKQNVLRCGVSGLFFCDF